MWVCEIFINVIKIAVTLEFLTGAIFKDMYEMTRAKQI